MKYCKYCKNARYTYPEGQPEFSEPCPSCNVGGKISYSEAQRDLPTRLPEDGDHFPFGSHRGTPYKDIRASYFIWLSKQAWIGKWKETKLYIDTHLDILEEEARKEKRS